jgi:murein DD-endopeptidase MepM/ murein hydrolase activator NlpD
MSALAVVGALGMPFPIAAFRAAIPAPEPTPDTSTAAVAPPLEATSTAAPTPAAAAVTPTTVSTMTTTTAALVDETTTGTVPAPITDVVPTTALPSSATPVEVGLTEAGVTGAGEIAADVTTATTIAVPVPNGAAAPIDPSAGEVDAAVENLVEGVHLRSINFPVAGPVTYSDDFGNCRDLCDRRHAGNDIIGLRLQPLLAAADGVVDHLVEDHPTAGWGVVIEDAEGWQYRYFHVNNDTPGTDDGLDEGTWRFAPGVGPGVAVKAGQILGWMGDSGNSESSVPHLHFEIRRPDGKAVNPFASLRWAQRLQQCLSPNGPFADMLFPVPEPAHEVELSLPAGSLLLDHLGLSFPRGRAWLVGDPRFHAVDGACPAPGALIAPPIAPTIAVPADPSAG